MRLLIPSVLSLMFALHCAPSRDQPAPAPFATHPAQVSSTQAPREQAWSEAAAQPSIELPPELDRVLRDYERSWSAHDSSGLAELFTEDGFVLSNGKPAVRGRAAIRQAYSDGGGPLALRAFAYATDGDAGYIIGGFASTQDVPDTGKFVLAIRRVGERWLIAADMDNSNRRPRPPGAPPPPQP